MLSRTARLATTSGKQALTTTARLLSGATLLSKDQELAFQPTSAQPDRKDLLPVEQLVTALAHRPQAPLPVRVRPTPNGLIAVGERPHGLLPFVPALPPALLQKRPRQGSGNGQTNEEAGPSSSSFSRKTLGVTAGLAATATLTALAVQLFGEDARNSDGSVTPNMREFMDGFHDFVSDYYDAHPSARGVLESQTTPLAVSAAAVSALAFPLKELLTKAQKNSAQPTGAPVGGRGAAFANYAIYQVISSTLGGLGFDTYEQFVKHPGSLPLMADVFAKAAFATFGETLFTIVPETYAGLQIASSQNPAFPKVGVGLTLRTLPTAVVPTLARNGGYWGALGLTGKLAEIYKLNDSQKNTLAFVTGLVAGGLTLPCDTVLTRVQNAPGTPLREVWNAYLHDVTTHRMPTSAQGLQYAKQVICNTFPKKALLPRSGITGLFCLGTSWFIDMHKEWIASLQKRMSAPPSQKTKAAPAPSPAPSSSPQGAMATPSLDQILGSDFHR